ncbi:IS256 family transposase, partial [Arthrobacter sp. H35-MC1]|nr:IS256 family transposase [Arthrobacter sp. H35-MC1]
HRGLSDDHAKRAVDWYLYHHTEAPKDPWDLVKAHHWQPKKKKQQMVHEPIGPALYDTTFSPEDGNGIQQGWGGRNH